MLQNRKLNYWFFLKVYSSLSCRLGFGTVVGSRTESGREQFREYWENSVEVGAEETQQIAKWAKEYGMYITIGVTEEIPSAKHCIAHCYIFLLKENWMGKHRKLKPTAAERLIWGEGDGTTLNTFDTEIW